MKPFTLDERRIMWRYRHFLCLPSLAHNPDWTIGKLKEMTSNGGDAGHYRRYTKTAFAAEWIECTAVRDTSIDCHCQYGCENGHLVRYDFTGRHHDAKLSWKRLHTWILSLTDTQRAGIAAAGAWTTRDNLDDWLTEAIGPPPSEPFDNAEPATVGDQYALFEVAS